MDISIFQGLAAILSGVLIGLLLGVFGGGGSVIAAPLLIYVVGISDPHIAIGTASAAVAANALVNLGGHWRAGRVKWPCAVVFAISGIAGAWAGSSLAKTIDGPKLLLGFAVAMAAIAVSMLRKGKNDGDPDVSFSLPDLTKLVPMGIATGFASGLFGIGGGFLIVPGLMASMGMTMANATASSLVSVAAFGLSTASNYGLTGQVNWPIAGLLLLGGAGGGFIGLRLSVVLQGHIALARQLFAGLILAVALFVAYRGWLSLFG
jgi:uncharacterized membrane protein YfcA